MNIINVCDVMFWQTIKLKVVKINKKKIILRKIKMGLKSSNKG